MLCEDIKTVEAAFSIGFVTDSAVDALGRIKTALTESLKSSHNKSSPEFPSFSKVKRHLKLMHDPSSWPSSHLETARNTYDYISETTGR